MASTFSIFRLRSSSKSAPVLLYLPALASRNSLAYTYALLQGHHYIVEGLLLARGLLCRLLGYYNWSELLDPPFKVFSLILILLGLFLKEDLSRSNYREHRSHPNIHHPVGTLHRVKLEAGIEVAITLKLPSRGLLTLIFPYFFLLDLKLISDDSKDWPRPCSQAPLEVRLPAIVSHLFLFLFFFFFGTAFSDFEGDAPARALAGGALEWTQAASFLVLLVVARVVIVIFLRPSPSPPGRMLAFQLESGLALSCVQGAR